MNKMARVVNHCEYEPKASWTLILENQIFCSHLDTKTFTVFLKNLPGLWTWMSTEIWDSATQVLGSFHIKALYTVQSHLSIHELDNTFWNVKLFDDDDYLDSYKKLYLTGLKSSAPSFDCIFFCSTPPQIFA